MDLIEAGGAIRGFEKFGVYRVEVLEGEGVEGDPTRIVIYWFLESGALILRDDPRPRPPQRMRL